MADGTRRLMKPHELQKLLGPEFIAKLTQQTLEDIRLGLHHLRNPRIAKRSQPGEGVSP